MTKDAQQAPAPEPFVREHVQAPENRLNLAMLAMLNVVEFRSWRVDRLQLPVGSVIYPPQNVKGVRPDFVVVEPDGTVHSWIEVELGSPDAVQLKTFRERLDEPVLCIAGADGGDLALGQIAAAVLEIRSGLDEQQAITADMLLKLIELSAGKAASTSYADPEESLRRQPLIAGLAEQLQDRLMFGTPPVPAGKILLSTITQKGWTLRLHSPASQADRSFSVMWNQAVGRGVVSVPAQAALDSYVPNKDAAAAYGEFLARTAGVDISQLPIRGSASVSEGALLERLDELAAILTVMSQPA